MINFFKMGEADFWQAEAMLSEEDFAAIWNPIYWAGLTDAYDMSDDYYEYVQGFETAWEAHDTQILRTEKPGLFEGFGAESRSCQPLVF